MRDGRTNEQTTSKDRATQLLICEPLSFAIYTYLAFLHCVVLIFPAASIAEGGMQEKATKDLVFLSFFIISLTSSISEAAPQFPYLSLNFLIFPKISLISLSF